MFCKNCGQVLDADAAFCSNCGAQVQSPTHNPDLFQQYSQADYAQPQEAEQYYAQPEQQYYDEQQYTQPQYYASQQAYAPAQPLNAPAQNKRWPIVCGVFAALFTLINVGYHLLNSDLFYNMYPDTYFSPFRLFFAQWFYILLYTFVGIALAVIFFVPTAHKPWTATIPVVVLSFESLTNFVFEIIRFHFDFLNLLSYTFRVIPLVAIAVLLLLQAITKTRNYGFSIAITASAGIYIFAYAIAAIRSIVFYSQDFDSSIAALSLLVNILNTLSMILLFAAVIIASFTIVKRRKVVAPALPSAYMPNLPYNQY